MPEPRPGEVPPPHVTKPLLSLVNDSALDEDYLAVAQHRPRASRSGGRAVAAAGVLGLLLAVAAVETAEGRGARESSRTALVTEAQDRRDLLGSQQERLAELREANVTDSATLSDLTASERDFEARLGRLRTLTGYGEVSGPGVRVEFEDPPGGDPADDMTLLLDGLWNAGAEAIALNGRRITTVTRIASTGPAVSVNGNSLAPPYTVLAVGDPATMQARFAESTSGSAFRTLADTLLFDLQITNADDLELPAATLPLSLTIGSDAADDGALPDRSRR